jgi:hypothetical protein
MAAKAGASIPAWLSKAYQGLDADVETRRIVAAAVLSDQVEQLRSRWLRTVSFLYPQPGQSDLRGLPYSRNSAQGFVMTSHRNARIAWMKQEAQKRLLLLDGSWGVMIQGFKLGEEDFRGTRFGNHPSELKGNNDLLTLTKPEIIQNIGRQYLEAGVDFIETNTFNSNFTSQEDYGLGHLVGELNEAGAKLARDLCDQYSTAERPRLVRRRAGPGQSYRDHFAGRQRSRFPQHHLSISCARPIAKPRVG